jgi:hypothetical protein
MFTTIWKAGVRIALFGCILFSVQGASSQDSGRTLLLEVLRTSWDVGRDETLIYLRVYSDGFAEVHSMRKVDFRSIQFLSKQLPNDELSSLKKLLSDPAIDQLEPEYSRYWGNRDFGYKYDVAISNRSVKHIQLENFQPFLARQKGKPYPKELEKLGCAIWKLRAEVSDEPLEHNWLKGCAGLGY